MSRHRSLGPGMCESRSDARAVEGKIVVPDNFSKWLFVPLSPTVCLCAHPEVNHPGSPVMTRRSLIALPLRPASIITSLAI